MLTADLKLFLLFSKPQSHFQLCSRPHAAASLPDCPSFQGIMQNSFNLPFPTHPLYPNPQPQQPYTGKPQSAVSRQRRNTNCSYSPLPLLLQTQSLVSLSTLQQTTCGGLTFLSSQSAADHTDLLLQPYSQLIHLSPKPVFIPCEQAWEVCH